MRTYPFISQFFLSFLFILFLSNFLLFSFADIGTATFYGTPFVPTSCYGSETAEIPTDNNFAAAGEAVWDNSASCGRQYKVRCISGEVPGSCIPGQTINVKIVDRGSILVSPPTFKGTTFVLSNDAFRNIAFPNATSINVEYQQV